MLITFMLITGMSVIVGWEAVTFFIICCCVSSNSSFVYEFIHITLTIYSDDWGEIFMKQSVNICRYVNFWNLVYQNYLCQERTKIYLAIYNLNIYTIIAFFQSHKWSEGDPKCYCTICEYGINNIHCLPSSQRSQYTIRTVQRNDR